MSYARNGHGSDLYVFAVSGNQLECHWCRLTNPLGDTRLSTLAEALAHFKEHEAAGHKVAFGGYPRLEADLRWDEDFIWNGGELKPDRTGSPA